MNFYSKYQLERLLVDGPAQTFRAVENSSGRPVFLHLFSPEGRLLFDTIAARYRDSAGRLTPPLIETGEFAGSLYVVTEVIEPFVNLPAWLESAGSPIPAAPAPPPEVRPVAGSSTKEPGEFTRMFGLGQRRADATPPAPAPQKEPGAFTREFMVSPAPTIAPPAAASQPAWPVEPVKPSPPPAPEAAKPPAQVWPKQPAGPVSGISDLFGTMLPGEHVDVEAEQARAAQSAPPAGKPFRRAGTFTRMFGSPRSVRKMSPERPKTVSSFFDSGIAATRLDQKIEAAKDVGPGEYTRMIAIPQQTEEPHPPPAQPIQAAVPVAAPQGNRALVIAFILIGVLVIAVIILGALLYSKS